MASDVDPEDLAFLIFSWGLTRQQGDILGLVEDDRSNREIARALGLNSEAVKAELFTILRKASEFPYASPRWRD